MSQLLTILSSVGFNWHVALANFFNFLIILFLLNVFFFKKLGKAIDERHQVIERGLSQASDAEKALKEAEEQKRSILQEAKKESHVILSEAEKEAALLVASLKDKHEKEIENKMKVLAEKEKMLEDNVEKEFMQKAPALVAGLYRATLEKEMNEQTNNAFVIKS
ncbi:MAG: synthase [Candidatus Parcubacteria bacterium]|jgi:F-type H+-transporting ATPase subunit b